ncbi:MAG: RidA family protein [Planctomycetota bacterium]|jgi:2-iminobutanoate/2-iminopropanoate deaminase
MTTSLARNLLPVLTLLPILPALSAQDLRIVAPGGIQAGASFSPGVLDGDFLHLCGSLGRDPETGKYPDGIEAQVRQTFANIEPTLKAAGLDFSDVVRVNVFLTDTRDYAGMNQVYRSFFKDNPPTRATVQADLAVPGALVEIEMVAALRSAEKKVIKPSKLATPALPFSWGIEAGDYVFVAGATSRNPETFEPVGGDIETQTRQVLSNIGAVLEEAGLTYDDVVECSVFLDDPRDFAAMNGVYRSVFKEAPPARATMRAKLMNPIHKIEIQCVAAKGGDRRAVYPEGANRNAPYSPAIAVHDRLYLAGCTGRGPDGYAPGDLEAQTRQALARLKTSLEAEGLDYSDVISARVYLSDMRYFQAMNAVYKEIMPEPRPTRSTVGSVLMSPEALVEIQFIASKKH